MNKDNIDVSYIEVKENILNRNGKYNVLCIRENGLVYMGELNNIFHIKIDEEDINILNKIIADTGSRTVTLIDNCLLYVVEKIGRHKVYTDYGKYYSLIKEKQFYTNGVYTGYCE